jgi:hypothetical protein
MPDIADIWPIARLMPPLDFFPDSCQNFARQSNIPGKITLV